MSSIRKVGIVGCGLNGCAIARVVALAGYEVRVCEISQATLDLAFEKSSTFFKRQSMIGMLSDIDVQETLSRIHGTVNIHDLVESDLVMEAIPENLTAKMQLMQELDQLCPPPTILISHTSSLSLAPIAAATQRPEKVGGLHFLHPIHMIRLVEVVKTLLLDPSILKIICEFVQSLKRDPITVMDAPGLVVNRLIIAHLLNAVRIFESGIATKEDIDKAIQVGCGHPMGPFVLLDYLGLDRVCRLANNLYQEYQEPQYLLPESLKDLVEAGHLGKQSGQGFYSYHQE
jgi:3-hydroxybutyryl-CoA dehydrogenase